jgi:hypothetical protein
MLAFNAEGLPSATASKDSYLRSIESEGFEAAHTSLLEEAKEWLLSRGHKPESVASEGKLLHHSATYLAREAGVAIPDRGALCILLTNVFDPQGIAILTEERAGAAQAVQQFMNATGVTDEAEARKRYVEASIAAAVDARKQRRAAAPEQTEAPARPTRGGKRERQQAMKPKA